MESLFFFDDSEVVSRLIPLRVILNRQRGNPYGSNYLHWILRDYPSG